MAVVNHEQRFVYLFEPHTASRATLKAFMEQVPYSIDAQPHHAGLDKLGSFGDFNIFATVRNPFDVLVTKYLHHRYDRKRTFREFIEQNWNHNLTAPGQGLWQEATSVVTYERLQEQLNVYFGLELDYDPVHKTREKKGHWRSYYADDLYERLAARADWQQYRTQYGYLNDECTT